MKKFIRWLFGSALLLGVASIATCTLGRAYEISKLPDNFPDKDIVGLEWEFAGIGIFAGAILFTLIAGVLWIIEKVSKSEDPNSRVS